MAVITQEKGQSILERWDLTNFVESGARLVAAVVYDTRRDVFLLLPCEANPKARRAASQRQGGKLSLRELQILQLVAAGFDNRDLADKLQISVNTVKVHLQSIFVRLKVTTRNEAVARAIQDGWIKFSRHANSEKTAYDQHTRFKS